jgi:glycosyltransferase involved in cell wall biosynthesis
MLSAMGRLNPPVYRVDRTGRRLIDVVPFGLSSEPPSFRGPVLKGVHPRIAPTDRLLLWFGGVWNWLDPLTVIRAFADLSRCREGLKLVFVTKIPSNQSDPEARMIFEAIGLSRSLGLLEDKILFLPPVPYARRESLLLEADIGLCFHPEHLETRFSYRTRVLDYIWAGLPIITGAGDVLGEMVHREGLGLAVAPGDERGFYLALERLTGEPDPRRRREQAFTAARSRLAWEAVASPLLAYCRSPWQAADSGLAGQDAIRSGNLEKLVCENIHQKYQIKMLEKQIAEILNRRVLRLVKPIEKILSKIPGLVRRQGGKRDVH